MNPTAANSIENIILGHSQRGMDRLRPYLVADFCAAAARSLWALPRGNVLLTTGFYVAGHAETDGPVGTVLLGQALQKIGFNPIIISDHYGRDIFAAEGDWEVVYVPMAPENEAAYFNSILDRYHPVGLLAIERCGRTDQGDYLNMRGISIRNNTAPIDQLFIMARARHLLTIGIGDGGNEIGMGNLQAEIRQQLDLNPCTVEADHLIIATVSNWGAYGLLAALQAFTSVSLLPPAQAVENYLVKIVQRGCVDGVTQAGTYSVDGYDVEVEKEVLEQLSRAVQHRGVAAGLMRSN